MFFIIALTLYHESEVFAILFSIVDSIVPSEVTFSSNNLSITERDTMHDLGIKIVSVYQNRARKIDDFSKKHAKLDALSALLGAKMVEQPHGSTIYFAVDYDVPYSERVDSDMVEIVQYFEEIKSKIGERYQIGVYGGGDVCDAIKQIKKIAKYSWLSHSTGFFGYSEYDTETENGFLYNIKQAEEFEKYGIDFDEDTAVGDDYGQW